MLKNGGKAMTREEQFERMLSDIRKNYAEITAKMDKLKAEGKTKTVTFRELMGNRMILQNMLSMYRSYGLID